MPDKARVHATCVALDDGEGPQAVLLRGPSGAGKSDFALRLIEQGWSLVADDQTDLTRAGERVVAAAPPALCGLMEVRGVGIMSIPTIGAAPLALVVDLGDGDAIERLPEPERCELLGVPIPRLTLNALEASATVKLRLALEAHAAPDRERRLRAQPAPLPAADGPATDQAKPSAGGAPLPQRPDASSPKDGRRRVVVITGLSGSGRTSALNALEDLGYEAIGNPPLDMVEPLVDGGRMRPLVVGVDIRTRNFALEPLIELMKRLMARPGLDAQLIYIHCDDEELRRRFTTTRRRHPLAQDRPLTDGIAAERRMISPLRGHADLVLDTTTLTPWDLREILSGHLSLEGGAGMTILVTSFSYRKGLPRAADLVLDVRFLNNPYYQEALRPLSGCDEPVARFVRQDPGFAPFFNRLQELIRPLLPRYEREGKSYLTIAFGCTGGRHRSVMMAEALAAELRRQGRQVTLVHRDIKLAPQRA